MLGSVFTTLLATPCSGPFLGPLFRSNEFSDDRKELLIFVSPRVVQTPDAEAS